MLGVFFKVYILKVRTFYERGFYLCYILMAVFMDGDFVG